MILNAEQCNRLDSLVNRKEDGEQLSQEELKEIEYLEQFEPKDYRSSKYEDNE